MYEGSDQGGSKLTRIDPDHDNEKTRDTRGGRGHLKKGPVRAEKARTMGRRIRSQKMTKHSSNTIEKLTQRVKMTSQSQAK